MPGTTDSRAVLTAARKAGQAALDEAAAKDLLQRIGIAVPRGTTLAPGKSLDPDLLLGMTPPFALKALAPVALHKSDLGAVKLKLGDAAAVEAARADMAQRLPALVPVSGYRVEEMAAPGLELVIGGLNDPRFGPAIMVGLGGVFVEIFNDVAFRLCPITRSDAETMLDELTARPLIDGARGGDPADRAAVIDTLLALGGAHGLFTQHADLIAEFDLNPLFVGPPGAGCVAVDARIVLQAETRTETTATMAAKPDDAVTALSHLFDAKTIAVVGASATSVAPGNRFIKVLRDADYPGAIYPIHPKAQEIEGLPAYVSLGETPEPVDYAYVLVGANRVADALKGANGRVRVAQVMASGFSEGSGDTSGEVALIEIARAQNMRLIGPNCMGSYSPRARLNFIEGVAMREGTIGVATQSGGLGIDVLRRGQAIGLRFSGLSTIGNSIDIDAADMLEYYLADPATRAIGLYVEDVKDGRRFFRLLLENAESARAGRPAKPVVLLVGGATEQGSRAAASHTGALAGNAQIWQALSRQTGTPVTDTLDSFLNTLLACQHLTPRRDGTATTGIALFGNGGGTSVLAADAVARAGFTLPPMPEEGHDDLARLELPPGASLANPIDTPAFVLQSEQGRIAGEILAGAFRHIRPDAAIVHLNLTVITNYRHVEGFVPNLMTACLEAVKAHGDGAHMVLVLRSDGSEDVSAWRRELREAAYEAGIPTFEEIPAALAALGNIALIERTWCR